MQGPSVDALSALFLICFGIGLLTSLGALLLGAHGGSGGHVGSVPHSLDGGGAAHAGGMAHAALHSGEPFQSASPGSGQVGQGTHGGPGAVIGPQPVSAFNLNTLLGFLLGFGAAGFIVRRVLAGIPLLLNILAAALGGLAFAYIIYWILAKILIRGQSEYLRASDFDVTGMEGIVSSTLFAGHLGEVSYILNGGHAAMPAREQAGREIKKGEPVVIVEVRQGVAVVLPKREFMKHAQTKKEE